MEAVDRALRLIFYEQEPSESQKNLITEIGWLVQSRLLARLRQGGLEVSSIPEPLCAIATELIIRRFNRIGSEGMKEEHVEGHSASYAVDDWSEFWPEIDAFAAEATGNGARGKVRFL